MAAHVATTPLDASARGFRPRLAISMGDPAGIGAEIICKALAEPGLRAAAGYRIHGSQRAMLAAAGAANIKPFWTLGGEGSGGAGSSVVLVDAHADEDQPVIPPSPSKRGGEASFRWVEDAIGDAQRPASDPAHADAIVTAPISKTS